MRKYIKKEILSTIGLIQDIHSQIKILIKNEDFNAAIDLMTECQQLAIVVGNEIEKSEGNGQKTVTLLEIYCESLYQYSCVIADNIDADELFRVLTDEINNVIKHINEYQIHYEILFLPYKASMWDSLESIWISFHHDISCRCYVSPIPYYYKNPDGSFGELTYEGELFPDYIDITHWNDYIIEEHKPDVIFIHNPYDDGNRVTSVHPDYYCKELKKYTEMLVYVPYFVSTDYIDKNLCVNGGTFFSDRVIVQSEEIRKIYVEEYVEFLKDFQHNNRIKFNLEKFVALGSPKIDKVLATNGKNVLIPDRWKSLIEGKKVVLYNTTITDLLEKSEKVIDKLNYVLNCFKEYKNEITLLWRPHPLSNITCYAMRPKIVERYINIIEKYKAEGWGIYDESPDVHRALAIADAYFGDKGSLLPMYGITGKPIMVQDYDNMCNYEENSSLWVEDILQDGDFIWFPSGNYNGLFRYHCTSQKVELMCWLPGDIRNKRMYGNISRYKNLIVLTPLYSDSIVLYNMDTHNTKSFLIKEPEITSNRYMGIDRFFATIIFKHYAIFVGATYPAIIRMNLESNEIEYFYEPIIVLERWTANYGGMNFRKEVVTIDNMAYLACRNANIVMEINLVDCSTKIWRVGESNSRYGGICYDGECFWLLSYCDATVTIWNMGEGKIKKLSLYTDNNEKTNCFAGLSYCEGYVWIFSQMSDIIFKVNTSTYLIEKINLSNRFQNLFSYENMKGMIRYFFIKCIDNVIYAYSTLYNVIIRLDIKSNELLINEMIIPRQIRDYGYFERNSSDMHYFWENEVLSIRQYLNMIAYNDIKPYEKQIMKYSQYFMNTTNNCGQTIYQYIKKIIS